MDERPQTAPSGTSPDPFPAPAPAHAPSSASPVPVGAAGHADRPGADGHTLPGDRPRWWLCALIRRHASGVPAGAAPAAPRRENSGMHNLIQW